LIRREDVTVVTLRQLSAQFSPRAFDKLSGVRMEIAGRSVEIHFRTVWHPSTYGCARKMIACPICDRAVFTLGFYEERLACRLCIGWKSPGQRRAA
jgi:hypothetical protein